mgnify:CR=1 FL=1
MKTKVWDNEKIEKFEDKKKLIILLSIISFTLMFVFPPFFFLGIAFLMLNSTVKQQRKLREKIDKENTLLKEGYKKICDEFFINNDEHKLNILGNVYGFSQIIDCELIENRSTLSYTMGTSKIKYNNKANLSYMTSQLESCNDLEINITVDDFNNPRIVFDCKYGKRNISKNSAEYKEYMNNAQNIISTLKIVISQKNEKYIETGTITKVEHKYITEENASIQIERLSKLHKDGILTDYEFEMKKKELLDKIK